MKKLAKFLMLPVALFAALGFAACQPNTPTSSSSSQTTGGSSSSEVVDNSSSSEIVDNSSSSEVVDSSSSSSAEEVFVAPTTVAEAVAAAVENADKVVTGMATKNSTTTSWGEPKTTVSNLTYGMIQGKYVETTMVTGPDSDDPTTEAFRYVLMESGSVYGVAYSSNNDGWTAAYDSTVEKLNGYSFNLGDSLTANGAENWLNTLYTWAKELPAKNKTNVALTESVDEGVYSFAFDYATSLYYKVSVSFTLDEKGMCDSLDWTAKIWYNGQTKDTLGNWLTTEVTDDEGNVTNVPAGEDWNGVYVADFAWDVENECWYLVAKEDSWDDEHVWTLTQSAEGEVVDQASQFRITSLAIKDLEGNAVPAELTMVPGGDALYLVMADVVPAEAVFTANNIEAVVDSESYGLSVAVGYYDDTTWDLVADGIKITAYGVGEYPVSITVNGEVVASFTVKVEAPLPESLDAAVYVDEYDTQTIDGTHSMFVGKAVTIIAKADNRFANANAEFTVVDASGEEVDCYTLTTVSTAGGEISAIVFAPTAVGTYTVTLVSTVVDGLTATATIEVKAPADLNTILTGTYLIDNYGTPCGTIAFDNGVATIEVNMDGEKTRLYTATRLEVKLVHKNSRPRSRVVRVL